MTTSQGQYPTNSSWENLETTYSSLKFPNCLLNLPCWGWFNFWGVGCTTPSSIERGKLSASNLRLIPLPLFLSPSSDGLQGLVERICSFSVWISTLFLRTSCVCRTMGCWREGYDVFFSGRFFWANQIQALCLDLQEMLSLVENRRHKSTIAYNARQWKKCCAQDTGRCGGSTKWCH